MTNKFIRKYMRFSKAVAYDQNPCLSRAIGSVIVNPELNCIISTGYNGPAKGVPHADTYQFLEEYVFPQLSEKDKEYIKQKHCSTLYEESAYAKPAHNAPDFARFFEDCKFCPRKLVGAISGERLELCACSHSEQNAINNAAKCGHSTNGCYIFCWCCIPCVNCSNSIINAGLSKIYCLKDVDKTVDMYNDDGNAWRLKKAGLEIIELEESWINND